MPDSASPTQRLFDALIDGDPLRAARQLDTSYRGVDTMRSAVTVGRDEAHAEIQAGLHAFPSPTFSLHHWSSNAPHETILWQMDAVHEGTFLQIPPTDQQITVMGIGLFTVRNQQITRGIHLWDLAGLLRDVQLLPDLPDPRFGTGSFPDLSPFEETP